MPLPVVGLTGGIASGKSTVARAFESHGARVIDADQLAREVVEPGTPGLAAIVEAFGEDVLLADGQLDRKALGARVFADEPARQKLNAITHPRIAALGAQRMMELQDSGAPYLMYEAALIVENGAYRTMGALVVVASSTEAQTRRVLQRDGLDEQEARARIASQAPLERKLEVADYVVHNDGGLDELRVRVREVHEALLERFGKGVPE